MSDIGSAGSNGKTCRQDVLRGVDVPVVPGAAGRAQPCPGAEGEFRGPAGPRCGAGSRPAGGADLAVRAGDLGFRLGPVGGALVAAGQAPLVAGQAAFPPGQAARAGDLVPVRGDGEMRDAQVHAGNGTRRRERRGLGHVDGEGDVPAPARVAGDRHRARVERRRVDVRPRPGELQRRARLGEEQLPLAVPESRPGVLGALPPGAGLVPGTQPNVRLKRRSLVRGRSKPGICMPYACLNSTGRTCYG